MMSEGVAGATSTPAGALHNAWLEVFVLHARALTEFLIRPTPRPEHRDSDICLRNFGVDFNLEEVEREWLRARVSVPAHKAVAHLTWDRTTQQVWELNTALRILEFCERWRDSVKRARGDLGWGPFDATLRDARIRVLPCLPRSEP